MSEHGFEPNYTVPPGAMLAEYCLENGFSKEHVLEKIGLPEPVVMGLMDGSTTLDAELAARLQRATSIPSVVWRNLEAQFRDGVAKGRSISVQLWITFPSSSAVSGWTGAVNEIIYRRDRPDTFSDEGFDPPCPHACNLAIEACHAMVNTQLRPSRVEQGPSGEIEIGGPGWRMEFQERDDDTG